MKYLDEVSIKNKVVLLRCDFNVPIKDGIIGDNSKIIKSLDTINYLLNNDNKVIILSHFGRVKTEDDKKTNSLKPVYIELQKYLNIKFIDDPLNLEAIKNDSCSCFLVENTRFTDVPEKRESVNDLTLAKYWASFGDVFVVDAFASLHRAHSSTAGISKYLPTYLGFLVKKELESLKPLIVNRESPLYIIMGGAKLDDKIKIISNMLLSCDKLFITGGILNTFLKVMKKNIGQSLVSNDEEILREVEEILNKYKHKIYFSDLFVVQRQNESLKVHLQDIQDNDIIYDNLLDISPFNLEKSLIFFNGTCGKFEDAKYGEGTLNLLQELKNCQARVFIGGGDTVAAVTSFGFQNDFEYLSSGGGATLEYVAFKSLKALDFIKENNVDN